MARGADEGPTGDEHVLPDVEDDLDEESFQRLTGKRRARLVRQRIAFAVVVVVVLAVGGGAYLVWSDRWHPRGAARPSAAASPTCTPAVAPALLAPKDVAVDVLNGTSRKGLAGAVAAELRTRGFVVAKVANAPQATGPATAVVTYPGVSVQQAVTVAARFPEAQLVQDDAVKGVSVSLGDGYQQLLAEQALVAPVPAGQPGAC